VEAEKTGSSTVSVDSETGATVSDHDSDGTADHETVGRDSETDSVEAE